MVPPLSIQIVVVKSAVCLSTFKDILRNESASTDKLSEQRTEQIKDGALNLKSSMLKSKYVALCSNYYGLAFMYLRYKFSPGFEIALLNIVPKKVATQSVIPA